MQSLCKSHSPSRRQKNNATSSLPRRTNIHFRFVSHSHKKRTTINNQPTQKVNSDPFFIFRHFASQNRCVPCFRYRSIPPFRFASLRNAFGGTPYTLPFLLYQNCPQLIQFYLGLTPFKQSET